MWSTTETPRIGLAYAAYVPELVRRRPGLVDHVEIPFERLRHDPATARVIGLVPTVLHCASLSVAGVVPATDAVIDQVRAWAVRTATPWVGEHLAFVRAPGLEPDDDPVDIGYTVAPPLHAAAVERVAAACARYQAALGVPLLLENPPQYFATPGSTMDQPTFLTALCARSDVGLLLDLSHFFITMRNTGVDPFRAIEAMPLERAREIHLSGVREEESTAWDEHGTVAPPEVFELLAIALRRARPEAITLEYNWSAEFPEEVVVSELARTRTLAQRRGRT